MSLCLLASLATTGISIAQESANDKVKSITSSLMILCLAGGEETVVSAEGKLELNSKVRDILSGKIGASADGMTTFSKTMWSGIIGGIAKDMSSVQSAQATEARKCMIENGFELVKDVLKHT